MVVSLFIFSFLGPLVYTEWGEIELDESGKTEYSVTETTYTVNGKEYTVKTIGNGRRLALDYLSAYKPDTKPRQPVGCTH